jgi:Kef-type K+ transport system membrane component KefB
MNTRGLMELIVLNVGLDLGILSPRLFTMMVLMALVTTAMTGPLLTWIQGNPKTDGPGLSSGSAAIARRES